MTAIATSKSYRIHPSANHCALRGSDPGNVCWGQVEIVDQDEDETNSLFACQGHLDKVKHGYRAPYHKEKSKKSNATVS